MRVSLAAVFCLVFLFAGAASPAAADTGTATVRVVTSPPLGSGTFRFSGTPSGELTLSGAEGSMSAAGLVAGTYNSTLVRTDPAAVEAGYQLTSITCDDDDSTGGVLSRRTKFEIAAGEAVTCTFLLTKTDPESPDQQEPGNEQPQDSDTSDADEPQIPDGDDMPTPGSSPVPQPFACICPKEGSWTINNLPGQMACTGAANMTMPLKPSTQRGTLTIQNGCNTIIGESLSEDDATLVMQRLPGCGYQGTIGGSQGGIPMNIEFTWTVNSETNITGDLYSQVTERGMTCTMTRNYNMNAAN